MRVEVRKRQFDAKWAVWRENLEPERTTAWDCIAVIDDLEAALALRNMLKEKKAA